MLTVVTIRTFLLSVLIAAMAAMMAASSVSASSLEASGVKLSGYFRVQSWFSVYGPTCVQDEWGFYPDECTDGDLSFRVARRTSTGAWRSVLRDGYPVYVDWDARRDDRERIYYWQFSDYSYFTRKCRRLRVCVTFIDALYEPANPRRTLYWRACYGG